MTEQISLSFHTLYQLAIHLYVLIESGDPIDFYLYLRSENRADFRQDPFRLGSRTKRRLMSCPVGNLNAIQSWNRIHLLGINDCDFLIAAAQMKPERICSGVF